MKVFTFKKVHLVIFVCLIICICGIIVMSVGEAIHTNATPATNKTVVLDAGHGAPDYRDTKCEWYYRTRTEFANYPKVARNITTKWSKSNTYTFG